TGGGGSGREWKCCVGPGGGAAFAGRLGAVEGALLHAAHASTSPVARGVRFLGGPPRQEGGGDRRAGPRAAGARRAQRAGTGMERRGVEVGRGMAASDAVCGTVNSGRSFFLSGPPSSCQERTSVAPFQLV